MPGPTTFGRWLRRAGARLVDLLDELLWRLVRARWAEAGGPEEVTLALNATVRVRYGENQGWSEHGYNPRKPGRLSHHPLLAFVVQTGYYLSVRRHRGSAWTGKGTTEWLPELVGRLRAAGVERITVRLDKWLFSEDIVRYRKNL